MQHLKPIKSFLLKYNAFLLWKIIKYMCGNYSFKYTIQEIYDNAVQLIYT